MRIGIAGGIGSGKSYVCALIRQRGFEVYDCDSAAKRLIRTDPDIRRQLTALIGPDTYTAEGQLNKAVVARFLLASDANAAAIDAIVHPAVFRDFEASGLQWLESAIMYESGTPWRYASAASCSATTSPAPRYSPGWVSNSRRKRSLPRPTSSS